MEDHKSVPGFRTELALGSTRFFLILAKNSLSLAAIGRLYLLLSMLNTAVPRKGPTNQPRAAQLMVMRPSVKSGSSGMCPSTLSATPELSATAPPDPVATDPSTLNADCHRRRALRSWKNVFQSSTTCSEFAAAVAAALATADAARASASASAVDADRCCWWLIEAGWHGGCCWAMPRLVRREDAVGLVVVAVVVFVVMRRFWVCFAGFEAIEAGEIERPAEYGQAAVRRRVGWRAPAERPAPARSMMFAVDASILQRCRRLSSGG